MTTRGAAKRPATAGRIVVGARACDRQERHCRSRSESDEGRSPIGSRSFFGSPRRQIRSASARIGRDARFVSRGHRRPRAETITSLSVRVAMVHPSPDGDNSVTEHRGRHAAGARAHSYGTATGRRQVATLMRGVRCGCRQLRMAALLPKGFHEHSRVAMPNSVRNSGRDSTRPLGPATDRHDRHRDPHT